MRRRFLLASNLRSILVPKLDSRCVCALREVDANGIALAVGSVIFPKLLTQAGGLDPHEGIGDGVERLGTLENFQSDVVGLQPLTSPSKSFIDEVLQESLPAL